MCLVLDQGDDHAVQVEEEQDEVEPELGEGFLRQSVSPCSPNRTGTVSYLLVHVELPEDLSRVQEMRVVDDPTSG